MIKAIKDIRGLLPYILVVFFNAIIDLGDKILLQNAIFKHYDGSTQIILTAFVNSLIILPAIMLFTPAGFLSDRFSKTVVLRESSKVALILTVLIMFSYFFGLFKISLFLTFLLAAQSAIFFPAKYGLIKELFGRDRLPEGNGIVQATTIIAILLSSFVFSILFEGMLSGKEKDIGDYLQSSWSITSILVALALIQVWLTQKVPMLEDGDSSLQIDKQKYKKFGYIKENISLAFKNSVVFESIIGLGLFYGISQVLLAIFGVHLEEVSGEHNTIIAQGIMAMAGVGIAIGALLTAKYSKNYIETGLIPIGITGIVGSIIAITQTSSIYLLGFEFLIFGIFGGFILVILNSLIQFRSEDHELGRVMATSNLIQNLFMFAFLSLTVITTLNHVDIESLFKFLWVIASISLIYTLITLPQFLLRFLFKFIASFRYRLETFGVKNFPKDGAALLLGNHVSYIDWMVLSIASPRRVSFVIERKFYEKWYLKPIFKFFGLIPISSRGSKNAFKEIRSKLDEGKIVALFPEGAITRNGHLGTFAKGFELALKDVDVPIIPFYIRGLWGSRFSFANDKHKENVKYQNRDVSVTFGEPLKATTTATQLKQVIFELETTSWSRYIDRLKPLQNSWLKMAKRRGEQFAIADATGSKLSSQKFAAVVKTFSKKINHISKNEQNIGIVMPSSVGGAIINMATLMVGKTVVNLNYTSNKVSLKHAISMANIKTIYTSKQFITKLKAKGFEDIEETLGVADIVYVEDLKKDIKKVDILKNWAAIKILPLFILEKLWLKNSDMGDTAAILFSSGSEGTPKGIELTHKNFMANIKQFSSVLNFKDGDTLMATLPIFHVFGMTVTLFAPLIEGLAFICQPDPTDAVGVGKLAAKYKATHLFGTSTFFRIYTKNRKLIPLMFKSIRFVVGGAEKVSTDVRESFKRKFGLDIYEAYGATETSPGISSNIEDVLNSEYWSLQIGHKTGSVGMPFPGTSCQIVDPERYEKLPIDEAGMIIVSGPQVMKGYLGDGEKTKEVIIQKDGKRWYITGDKGKLDSDGFLYIVDRYSRFAKIAGEMVSLGAVEEAIRKLLPDDVEIIAANTPDSKKGERVVLLCSENLDISKLKDLIKNSDLNPLMVPSEYHSLKEMPKLGSGKSDLKKAKQLAIELSSKNG
jgi:acyl-[acyl-carrier-protein]-phospholipid O-acyltransferase/long-chain-fatty-acid--[acyl-carrier-protein] ligase